MKSLSSYFQNEQNIFLQIHAKVSSFTAHLIGPLVFNFGIKEEAWNLSTADLLAFPEGSVGKTLGHFLKKSRLEPIAGAESHDLYHILFDFSTSIKDEVALQFFLRGNGKKSIASFGTSIGSWIIFPRQWSYFIKSKRRGASCKDVTPLACKTTLYQNYEQLRKELFKSENTNQ
jgi:hypothetical protein